MVAQKKSRLKKVEEKQVEPKKEDIIETPKAIEAPVPETLTKETTPVAKESSSSFTLKREHIVGIVLVLLLAVSIWYLLPNKTSDATAISGNVVAPPLGDIPVARVNDEEITTLDVLEMKQALQQQTGQAIPDNVALDRVLSLKLFEQEAAKQGIMVTPEEAEVRLDEIATTQGFTLDEIKVDLETRGESYDELVTIYQTQLATEVLIDSILAERDNNIKVSELEAKAFYDGNQELLFPAGTPEQPFDEMKEQIIAFLTQQEKEQILRDYLLELKDAADIEIYAQETAPTQVPGIQTIPLNGVAS